MVTPLTQGSPFGLDSAAGRAGLHVRHTQVLVPTFGASLSTLPLPVNQHVNVCPQSRMLVVVAWPGKKAGRPSGTLPDAIEGLALAL